MGQVNGNCNLANSAMEENGGTRVKKGRIVHNLAEATWQSR